MISALVGIFVVVAMIRDMRNPKFWLCAAILLPVGWFLTNHENNKRADETMQTLSICTNDNAVVLAYILHVEGQDENKRERIRNFRVISGSGAGRVLELTLDGGRTVRCKPNDLFDFHHHYER